MYKSPSIDNNLIRKKYLKERKNTREDLILFFRIINRETHTAIYIFNNILMELTSKWHLQFPSDPGPRTGVMDLAGDENIQQYYYRKR